MSRTEAVEEWWRARERVVALVEEATREQLDVQVPACPDWTCLDLVRHMVGLAADVLDGDEPEDHHARWTGAQVERRRDRSVEQVLAEWARLADPLADWMSTNGSRPLNDVVVHEHDLRGALGVPGARDSRGLAIVRTRMIDRFGAALDGRTEVALVGETFAWFTDGTGSVEHADVVLESSDFDLARAVMSRRTRTQLRRYTTRGDVTACFSAFARMGPPPQAPLPE